MFIYRCKKLQKIELTKCNQLLSESLFELCARTSPYLTSVILDETKVTDSLVWVQVYLSIMLHVQTRLMSAFVIFQKSSLNDFREKYNFLCKYIFWYQIVCKRVIFKIKTNFSLNFFYKTF